MSFYTLNPKSTFVNSENVVQVMDAFPDPFKPLYYLKVKDKITLEDMKTAEEGLIGAERLEYMNKLERERVKKEQEEKESGIEKSAREMSTVLYDLITMNFFDYDKEQKSMQMVYIGVFLIIIALFLIFLNIPV